MGKENTKQVPVYLTTDKYDRLVLAAKDKRESLTRYLETALDLRLKKQKQ